LTIRIAQIIPVDLNAILHTVETSLSAYHAYLDNTEKAKWYLDAANRRKEAIHAILWNATANLWTDVLVDDVSVSSQGGDPQKHFYPSSLTPLWAKAALFDESPSQVLEAMLGQGSAVTTALSFIGGVPSSLFESGQQWDFPNAWPVHQYFVAEALLEASVLYSPAALQARDLIQRWITSNYCAWNSTGAQTKNIKTQQITNSTKQNKTTHHTNTITNKRNERKGSRP